ncbi:MAG: helix-turn-helix domain-containing protein, partial [Solobacterium sp.]|nr:helix-turn-helix domain-containing protein [Solobacterium sp.]
MCYNLTMNSMRDLFFCTGIILRIYPSDRQKDLIRRNGRASQFVYNRLVAVNREKY